MKKILKYELTGNITQIKLAPGFEVLAVQMQHGKPQIWILVNDYYPAERTYDFYLFATGEEIPERFNAESYLGTFQQLEGLVIWHVFIDLESWENEI